MKNKKGFTLVEILAVIALIGVVLLLVVPNVVGLFNNAKKSIFKDEAITIHSNSYTTYISRSTNGDYTKRFCYGKDGLKNGLDVEEKEGLYYDVTVDAQGNVISFKVADDSYGISLSNASGIKKKDVKNATVGDSFNIYCDGEPIVTSQTCVITDSKRECNILDFSYLYKNKNA